MREDGTNATIQVSVDGGEPRRERVSLLLYHSEGARLIPLSSGKDVVVGRGDDADVVIDDLSLSRRHARFRLLDDGSVELEDLGSTNGTRVRGEKISRVLLDRSAEAELGSVIASLHLLSLAGDGPRDLADHDAFVRELSREVERARHFRRGIGLLMIRALHKDGTPARRIAPAVQEHLRVVDSLGTYSPTTLELLLPEASLEEAITLARSLCSSVQPRLACGVALLPSHATSAEELVQVALGALRRAQKGEPVQIAEEEGSRVVERSARDDAGPVCVSPGMKELYRTAHRAARGHIPVLLLAETGAGKEVLARYIHETSPRKTGPLLSVNCAAIAESLLESTLFGHEKGAFTGAAAQHAGVFESAEGGTVFLDEIGELTLGAQAALLRVLESKMITRVGSTKEQPVDVRVIAATHRDLEARVQSGQFRQDLLYRLNAMTLTIPPLRERREDIPVLVERFLAEANRTNGTQVGSVAPDAMELLMAHAWPGNVRELKNAIERAAVISEDEVLGVEDLPMSLSRAGAPAVAATAEASVGNSAAKEGALEAAAEVEDFRSKMARLEAEVLLEALDACGGNQTQAARRLQMPLRTLVHKIKALDIRKSYERGRKA
ncbi:MAG: sigma 54-interacting transcriptional regulator [Polyangiaceae bacterium]